MRTNMELPHTRDIERERERACGELAHDERVAAHKAKQALTKHLALLASLGKLGLSEHMMQEANLRRQGRARWTVQLRRHARCKYNQQPVAETISGGA